MHELRYVFRLRQLFRILLSKRRKKTTQGTTFRISFGNMQRMQKMCGKLSVRIYRHGLGLDLNKHNFN